MKTIMIRSMCILAATLMACTTLAHDPAEHKKKNEKPNCAGIDHSKMDMDDPIAQAIMEQCAMAQADVKSDVNKHTEHEGMHSADKTKNR